MAEGVGKVSNSYPKFLCASALISITLSGCVDQYDPDCSRSATAVEISSAEETYFKESKPTLEQTEAFRKSYVQRESQFCGSIITIDYTIDADQPKTLEKISSLQLTRFITLVVDTSQKSVRFLMGDTIPERYEN